MTTFQIWESEDDGIQLGPKKTCTKDRESGLLGPTAVLIMEFQASSWNEACQRQYDHYGWGYYKPQDWEELTDED